MMSSQPLVFEPIASRAPPRPVGGPLSWLQRNLFDGWTNILTTLLLLMLLALALPPVFQWGLMHAVFGADNAACRAAEHHGACWGVVAEKYRLIFSVATPMSSSGGPWRPAP